MVEINFTTEPSTVSPNVSDTDNSYIFPLAAFKGSRLLVDAIGLYAAKLFELLMRKFIVP